MGYFCCLSLTLTTPEISLPSVLHLTLFDCWRGTGGGMQKASVQQERATSQIGSTQERHVDTDGPKQRAVWRDRHLSREKTDRGTAEVQDTHKASETPCWIHPQVCSLTHFRLSHELNMTPRRFVSPRHVCIDVCSCWFNKPKWEVFEHGYQQGCFILPL